MALNYKQLCDLLDCRQVKSLKRLLKARGIRWSLDRNGKPWTTEQELDRAVSVDKRKVEFSKPPCKKKNSRSRPASTRSTALGISSTETSGGSYAG